MKWNAPQNPLPFKLWKRKAKSVLLPEGCTWPKWQPVLCRRRSTGNPARLSFQLRLRRGRLAQKSRPQLVRTWPPSTLSALLSVRQSNKVTLTNAQIQPAIYIECSIYCYLCLSHCYPQTEMVYSWLVTDVIPYGAAWLSWTSCTGTQSIIPYKNN